MMKTQFKLIRSKKKDRREHSRYYDRLFYVLVCSLMTLVSACSLFPTPSQTGAGADVSTPTVSSTHIASATPSVNSSSITLQPPVNCPALSINWDRLVGTKSNVNKVQKVICGNLDGNGVLTALVLVRYYTSDATMDFYVYDNLGGTPTQRFAVRGLAQGDAQISPTNTVITAQNADRDPLGVNLFKEYQWNGSGFSQIDFPGMFPDMTHYQAEQVQASVNAQLAQATATPTAPHDVWQNSAFPVVSRLAQDLFHWPAAQVNNSVVTYNVGLDQYVIQATNLGPGGGGFTATLFRLDNVPTNIFEVKQIGSIDGTLSLASPAANVQLTSPVRVNVSYQSSGTILGRVLLYNDIYLIIGDTGPIRGSASTGNVTFAASAAYRLATPGLQEGLVAFYATNQNNIVLVNQIVMVKVLLST